MFLFGPRDAKNVSVSAQVNANEGVTISDNQSGERDLRASIQFAYPKARDIGRWLLLGINGATKLGGRINSFHGWTKRHVSLGGLGNWYAVGANRRLHFSAATTSADFDSPHLPTHACSTLPLPSISRVVGVAVSL